ncbi:hypothetical protein CO038_01080 [Candidatus Pacearchaeota archaeon CG_4_9_14_0_2_um_filter_39_13]|nr:hypothetical protein [Candidatus Pacearchaeota archaeon]OIO43531.1 MAG: hypothetical protein AUJ64_02320 [Candidatus Pacearchaeota archaeon CG1_02_39_14]PJC44946.1 MAG: hypothetical protein CO038_01080 [Candidatus Pacearchaeota archaeon CG_4_9_14_0_2_um_filter_39_13]
MIEDLKKYLKKNKINLIIYGETHGFLDDSQIQEEIIKVFNPTKFLYEMLEETELLTGKEKKIFLNNPDNKEFSLISTFGDLKKTIFLASKYNLPIVGNDIKNMGWEDKKILAKSKLTKEELRIEKEIIFKREKKQAEIIRKNLKMGEKVFATTGAFHLRKDSPLLNLQENYVIIYPIYSGNQLFAPPKNFDSKKVGLKIKVLYGKKKN